MNNCSEFFPNDLIFTWLEANFTNKDSEVVAVYFINTFSRLEGCPVTVRFDLGTENVLIERLQKSLRENGKRTSKRPPFFYGASPANQRIEAWWGILRQHGAQYWMDFFKVLRDVENVFNGSHLDKGLVQYCFLNVIQVWIQLLFNCKHNIFLI